MHLTSWWAPTLALQVGSAVSAGLPDSVALGLGELLPGPRLPRQDSVAVQQNLVLRPAQRQPSILHGI